MWAGLSKVISEELLPAWRTFAERSTSRAPAKPGTALAPSNVDTCFLANSALLRSSRPATGQVAAEVLSFIAISFLHIDGSIGAAASVRLLRSQH
jgi:hypothetical protein